MGAYSVYSAFSPISISIFCSISVRCLLLRHLFQSSIDSHLLITRHSSGHYKIDLQEIFLYVLWQRLLYLIRQGELTMDIGANTKIDSLLKEYPFLEDFLIRLSPKFKGLKNPIMRKTLGKVATLSKIADIGGLDLDNFLKAGGAQGNH
jgi:hypothetical protein